MFRTLRGKLMVSYVGLVLLTLVLSGASAGVLVTRVRREANLARMQATLQAVARRLTLGTTSWPETTLVERLGDEVGRMNGRMLLLSLQGEIVGDPDHGGAYLGQRIELPPERRMIRGVLTSAAWFEAEDGQEYWVIFVDAPGNSVLFHYVGLALPVANVDPPWGEVVGPLSRIGMAVILIAIVLAFVLARSLSRPIARMTEAAESIARGDYARAIGEQGKDEVGHLAMAFDRMMREVETTQSSQRDLLANITHDLRTPLTSIQGFAQAITDGTINTPEDYQRAARIIHGEADRMNHLVQDLLELARLEAGELDERQAIPMGDLLEAVVRNVEPVAAQSNRRIQATIPSNLPMVRADSQRLVRALTNLMDNAVKYSDKANPIQIEAEHFHPEQARPPIFPVAFGADIRQRDWVLTQFTNTGDIIAPGELSRVFERFYRGDKSRQQSEGSGLGLAIAREIILAHKGRIEAASDTELGTRIRVWLPASPAET